MSQLISLRSQLASSNSKPLLIEFALRDDRFATQVRYEGSDDVLLESIEGIANEADNINWPRSSPLQEVVPQSDSEGDYLAGIGRAGKSHWSVIVRPLSNRLGFDFDFACRAKEEPVWLGSSYRVSSACKVNFESEDSDVTSNQEELCISPRGDTPASFPATIRWRYQLSLAIS